MGAASGREAHADDEAPLTHEQRWILAVALVPLFMSLVSVSIVNVVLPSIQTSIGASDTGLQWVLTGYTLAFGVLLVPAGRLGDLHGRGRLFVLGVGLFGLASLTAGFAPDATVLNIARVCMGFGSGLLNPQTIGLIQQFFRGQQRGLAFGAFGAMVGVSVAIGPVLGGVLIALLGPDWGWRAAFLVNVPIAAVGITVALSRLPASAWRALPEALGTGTSRRRPDIDPVGIVLLAAATLAVMLPFLLAEGSGTTWLLLAVAAALLLLWIRWEARYKARGGAPMVDLELFRTQSFSYGSLLIGLHFMGMTSVWVVIALYLQMGLGYSALQAGLVGLPSAVLSAVSAAIAGRYVVQVGRRIVLGGIATLLLGLIASAAVILAHASSGSSIWWLLLSMSFVGLGQGSVVSPNQTLTLKQVPLPYAGSAGGILQTGQRIGTSIGIAAITALFFGVRTSHGWTAGAVTAIVAIAVIVSLAGVVGIADRVRERREVRQPVA